MVVLPEGFALPPVGYLASLLVVLSAVGVLLWWLRPAVTDGTVLSIVPWMVAGSAGHVLYVVDALPSNLAPMFGLPAVYLTIAAIAGVVWVVAETVGSASATGRNPATYLFATGVVAALVGLAATAAWGRGAGEVALAWSTLALVVAIALTATIWLAMRRWMPRTWAAAGLTGLVVLFGHGLDGISTAIGIDILGGVERSPVSDAVIGLGARLPVAAYLGDTWLFVLVKFGLAVAVLVLFREYLEEAPSQARALLAIIAAVGLGPGVHNILLFSLSV